MDFHHVRRRIDQGPFKDRNEAIRNLVSYHCVDHTDEGEAAELPGVFYFDFRWRMSLNPNRIGLQPMRNSQRWPRISSSNPIE